MTKHDTYSLLSDQEKIQEIFFDYELHSMDSFFVIDPEKKEYQTNLKFENILDKMIYFKKAWEEGKTIVIKNLENFINLTDEFGEGIDIHAYIIPNSQQEGSSFDWHTDDRTVWIKMLWGQKLFSLRYFANETKMDHFIKLDKGKKILIKKGQPHRAVPMGPSCLLSVGLPDSSQEDA